MEEVRVLDGINRWRYGRDLRVMAEWNAARHLPTVSGRHGARFQPVLGHVS
jgi:hypothetical protein